MRRTTSEMKRSAKENLKGNLGTCFLVEVAGTALTAVASWIPFAGLIVRGPLSVGTQEAYCKCTDHEKASFKHLFAGFKDNLGENFLLGLVKGIFIFMWALLFLIPGIVKTYSYAMAEYLMTREKDLTAMEAISESRRLMKGNKMRLFILKLSFIGWILLTIATLGMAAFYVVPYMNMAVTEFFNDIYYAE